MNIHAIIHRSYPAVMLLSLGLASPIALAQSPIHEQVLTQAFDDAQLKWGPCPAFLPKGCAIAVLHGDPAQDNYSIVSNRHVAVSR